MTQPSKREFELRIELPALGSNLIGGTGSFHDSLVGSEGSVKPPFH